MHRTWTRAILAPAVAVAAGTCVADEPSLGGERPLWTASVDLRIGAVDAPGPVFGQIHGMAATPEGGILVIDGQARRVAEFDVRGEIVRRFGRGGSGPGEFMVPAYVGLRDDTVWITDDAQRRVSYFTRRGEHLLTRRFPTPDLAPPYRLIAPRGPIGDGLFAAMVSMPAMAGVDQDVEWLPIVAVDGNGRPTDTLALRRYGTTGFVARNPDRPWAGFVTRQPFGAETSWEILPSYRGLLVVGFSVQAEPRLEVTEVSAAGDTVRVERHPYRPVPLPEERLRLARDDLTERVLNARGPGMETEAEARRLVDAALYAPEFLPTVTGLVLASDTDFYVRREEPAPDQPQRWTFFSDREPVADVLVPHGIEVHAAADGVLWGVMTDELDVAYVVRLRVGES